jgi:hypothetical protein
MASDTPDPLKPAHIPGQNPNTPERFPGSTRENRRSGGAAWIAGGVAAALIVGYALVLSGALSTDQTSESASSKQNSR